MLLDSYYTLQALERKKVLKIAEAEKLRKLVNPDQKDEAYINEHVRLHAWHVQIAKTKLLPRNENAEDYGVVRVNARK